MARWHFLLAGLLLFSLQTTCPGLERLKYNHPGLKVDLGVGLWAWPLPMDYDGDGDLDLVVSCTDVPFNGTYLFRNPGGSSFPTFSAPVKIGPGLPSAQISHVNGIPRVLTPGTEWTGFLNGRFEQKHSIFPQANIHPNKVRANQWRYVDFDGDDLTDLVVGIEDWTEYGWDDAYNAEGVWKNGPLHGHVYWMRNSGTNTAPQYASPLKVEAAGKAIDVFGMPSPSFADFDGDGDLDLLCGEFLDGFTYFQNKGTRQQPVYAAGKKLMTNGQPLAMHLQMITPTAIDWDGDGDQDLIVGDEDGRVAWIEHTGIIRDGLPEFRTPRYFQQEADDIKFGALVNPVAVDWDHDGDDDLICGNTAGEFGWIENLDGAPVPRWAAPRLLRANGKPIRAMAGPNGSIQGPAEAKWGYTSLSVADWGGDGQLDLVTNTIWGRIEWYRNLGGPTADLAPAEPVKVNWKGTVPQPAWNWWRAGPTELVTQWRTRPVVMDLDKDGLQDLVMLDHEGFLAWFRREQQGDEAVLTAGQRIFTTADGQPLQLNPARAGRSGRRQFTLFDWDGDGRLDLLADGKNIDLWQNVSTSDKPWAFVNRGPVVDHRLAGHTTCPTIFRASPTATPELLIGAEDGCIYRLQPGEGLTFPKTQP